MNFREFLIEKIDNTQNEADIVLHQIMHNVDESHVDYTDKRLDFNVGVMIKRSAYSRLYLTIIASESNEIKLAKNNNRDGFTLVIYASDFPKRMQIDKYLSNKNVYKGVKQELCYFIDNYQGGDEIGTTYEADKEINTAETFESLYTDVVENMKRRIDDYTNIAADINHQLENTANEAEKQLLIRSLEKLKIEYFGDTFKKFKKIAVEDMDVDLTRFDKIFKKKFDTRMENYYEYVINNL